MANEINYKIKISTDGEKSFQEIAVEAKSADEAIEKVVNTVNKASDKFKEMAATSLTLNNLSNAVQQLDSMFQGMVGSSQSFDASMRAVNTMAGKGEAEFEKLKGSVAELGKEIPKTREALADGLYQVISNGVPEDNWISFLDKSARASVGGIADLGQTVTVTSTIIKNYGMEWEAAAEIQDKIQMTAKNGVTSFEQLASALPRVSGNAATLGVSIDELMATFATLTGVSGNTAEVSTQLGAIFTALIKPSSEAASMAEDMGIKFDAAAIKAKGGMQNFLQSLDRDVKTYASAHDMLSEEIYAKLFGSAEALRALIPLNGELADTFASNVDAMSNSAGTIDEAFEQMASTGESATQMLRNQIAAFTDWIGTAVGTAAPYVSFASNTLVAFTNAMQLITSLRGMSSAMKANSAVMAIASVHQKSVAAAERLLAASGYTAAAGTMALNVAVGVLEATLTLGLSAVIGAIIGYFTSMGDSAEEAAGKLDSLKEAEDAFSNAASTAKSEIEMEKVKLQELINSHTDATETIEQLNQKYGESFGYHKTAAEWYDTLVSKSKVYCEQLGYEAQAKVLAAKKAAAELKMAQMEADGTDKTKTWKLGSKLDAAGNRNITINRVEVESDDYKALKEEVAVLGNQFDVCVKKSAEAAKAMQTNANASGTVAKAVGWQQMSYEALGKAIEEQKKKVGKLAGVNASEANKEATTLKQMEARYKKLGKDYGLSSAGSVRNSGKTKDGLDGSKLVADAETYKELGNNIKYYEQQLEKTKPSEKETISRLVQNIAGLKEKQAAIKEVLDAAGRPTELNTLENIDKEIQYQQGLRSKATAENIGGIDKEIRRLNGLKRALEDSGHASVGADQIHTYEELEAEIGYYEGKLRTASETERLEIQKQILSLQNLKKEWDGVLASVGAPDESKVNTIEELEAAITYYSNLQKKQSADEVANTQEVINRLEGKKKALLDIASIPTMANELAELGKLGNAELKMELQLIGIEGIKNKIRGLQKMLDDTKNPLGKEQRQEVMKMMAAYQGYENVLKKQNVTISQTWGSIKGIGNSVESLTETLKGDGNAWEKVCGVMDGMLGLYEGIKGIVEIVQILTAVTTAHAAAKIAEAGSETTESGTLAANAAAAATAAATTTAANSIATASWTALAAAEFMAAHAEIPFAGFGIASGFIGGMEALVAACAIPKFANGAIAYGPTLGLFGEYAGASSNPEVVAPLSKLQDLLDTDNGGGMLSGKVKFEIDGRKLVGVLQKEDKMKNRT